MDIDIKIPCKEFGSLTSCQSNSGIQHSTSLANWETKRGQVDNHSPIRTSSRIVDMRSCCRSAQVGKPNSEVQIVVTIQGGTRWTTVGSQLSNSEATVVRDGWCRIGHNCAAGRWICNYCVITWALNVRSLIIVDRHRCCASRSQTSLVGYLKGNCDWAGSNICTSHGDRTSEWTTITADERAHHCTVVVAGIVNISCQNVELTVAIQRHCVSR